MDAVYTNTVYQITPCSPILRHLGILLAKDQLKSYSTTPPHYILSYFVDSLCGEVEEYAC